MAYASVMSTLTCIGEVFPESTLYYMSRVLNYLEVGHWMRANGFDARTRVKTRYELFDLAAIEVGQSEALYLEFGVADGDSMRYFSRVLRNHNAHLHGFDSFEGLPSSWTARYPKGFFLTHGEPPTIDDPRVVFFKGLFQETLPEYIPPRHERLIINMDADLYSSTAFVLDKIKYLVQPGTLLYFDEFNHCADELRAFDEFVNATQMKFRLLGATRDLKCVLFRRDLY